MFAYIFKFCFLLQTELGANAILAVSIAACKAGAAEKEACHFYLTCSIYFSSYSICLVFFIFLSQVPVYKHIADLSGKSEPVLPVPAFTVISGGKHAGNSLAVQVWPYTNSGY